MFGVSAFGNTAFAPPAVSGDVVAPTITSRPSIKATPRKAWSTALSADEAVTWTKTGGADAASFNLSGNTLSLSATAPRQSLTVQMTATDGAGNVSVTTITVYTTKARRRSRGY